MSVFDALPGKNQASSRFPHLRSPARMMALEPRMMFDGAAAVTAGLDHVANPHRPEVVVIDPSIPDAATLVAGLKPGTEVITLDPSRDGVRQLAEQLSGRTNPGAIHIFSHGEEGAVRLGTAVLDESSIGGYRDALAAIGRSLAPGGDLLFYGCFVGRSTQGETLLRDLAKATGADIAASRDVTGSPTEGYNWSLEARVGSIEADIRDVITDTALSGYRGDLPDNIAPSLSGGTFDLGQAGAAIRVSTILDYDTVTDPDVEALRGIAVISADGAGTWQYSSDGTTWTKFGSVSDGAALLLSDASQVRFVPSVTWNGSSSLMFRAWDQTSGTASGLDTPHFGDTTLTGGGTAFSTGVAGARLTLSDSNPPDVPLDLPLTTMTGIQAETVVATNTKGDTVVAWTASHGDGNGYDIYARRFDTRGIAVGGEFLVNTTVAGDQRRSSVAIDDAGDFVVVWDSAGQESGLGTGTTGVYGQRYSASGTPIGGEFHVITNIIGAQDHPSIAMAAANGAFVVSWTDGNEISAQRFDASGAAVAEAFSVSGGYGGLDSRVAMDRAGDFVVVWTGPDGGGAGIQAAVYDAAEAHLPLRYTVNQITSGTQQAPAVAVDAAGDFVVAWESNARDIRFFDVLARRCALSGEPLGGEFAVSAPRSESQNNVAVAMSPTGEFSVVWQNNGQDGGIYARRYTASGVAVSADYRVNSEPRFVDNSPAVAIDGAGDTTVVWAMMGGDGSNNSLYAHRYDANGIIATALDLDADGSSGKSGTGYQTAFTSGHGAVAIADGDLSVSAVAEGMLSGAVVRITSNYQAGTDILHFSDGNGIHGVWNEATATLSLQGAGTLATYEAAIHSVTFEAGAVGLSTNPRTVTVWITDGTGRTNTAQTTIAMAAAPIIQNSGGGGASAVPVSGSGGSSSFPTTPFSAPPPVGAGTGQSGSDPGGHGGQGTGTSTGATGIGAGAVLFTGGPGLAGLPAPVTGSSAVAVVTPSQLPPVIPSVVAMPVVAPAPAPASERNFGVAGTQVSSSDFGSSASARSLVGLSGAEIAGFLRAAGSPALHEAGVSLETMLSNRTLRSREDVQSQLGGLNSGNAGLMTALVRVQAEIKQTVFRAAIAEIERGGLPDPFEGEAANDLTVQLPPLVRSNLAILIGIEDYGGVLPSLSTPLHDVNEIGRQLETAFGFQSIILRNPSRDQIVATLQAVSAKIIPGHSLIVYFAGHGYQVEKTGTGYWLPADAGTDSAANWISTADLTRFLGRIRAAQTLLVSDSCYSGALVRESRLVAERETVAGSGNAGERAVVALSSGGDEPVRDDGTQGHSVFAASMLDALNDTSRPKTGFQVFAEIKDRVSLVTAQEPHYGSLPSAGHQPGADFIFRPVR